MNQFYQQALEYQDWCIKHRRYLHQHPELSLQEKNTSAYCQSILTELGYQIASSWGYGFTADLDLNAKKTIALRADMDALPIQEASQHEFASQTPGVAHMCGHDAHMAIALTAARLIMENTEKLQCNVRFLFQPSEEKPPGGALGMIEAGCLDNVDEVYGLHNAPDIPVGQAYTDTGPFTAASDRFDLTLTGRGGHAACPWDCLDPLVAACQLVTTWQAIVSRTVNLKYPAVLSVTEMHAGSSYNVIPEAAHLSGTVRTFNDTARRTIKNQLQMSIESLHAQDFRCEFEYQEGYDPIMNHAKGVESIANAAKKILTASKVVTNSGPLPFGEDFSYYLQHRPGAFFLLGSGNEQKGITAPLHSELADIDEDALMIGAAIMTQLAMDFGRH